ncbi:MAG: tetratricopeptide repeat protein [Alphaproteobacteria bacterium]|nr:tetratricopeptide repeat protein [Alphaproteobacteria bacterium]MDP6255411.1 tetratricopeptide repeat protein [Alphaproteobacteria bacterium]MDP7053499.1 tetratricopeptide repeat protein [Alphaproteobacteria bacterium]MDP7230091.1 tetratricopeptide repeat protein [Alphaproteobacteria bacterium]HJM91805.1 tetratricopeptide repeat protein [Alphaproteobacteria bacterium]|tara:strand:+ start:2762 stop:4036 length:1275 start_codon:yes stop_codon:yes gene_type:complete
MLEDRYGNALSTALPAARDAYVDGVDRFLSAAPGAVDAFEAAVAADPAFALAHVGLARAYQLLGRAGAVAEAIAAACGVSTGLTAREAGHVAALDLLLKGHAPAAYQAIRSHMLEHPRDAMVAQTCTGVFGLIGFSGQPGREAEQLAFTAALAPHYGDDWWFLAQHAFSQVEAGQIGSATDTIERALAAHPRNAHGAHIRAHIYYEAGETDAGYRYVGDWREGYDRAGAMHCHIAWHVAIWALERGDLETMWAVIDADVAPDVAWGPPLNVLTDNAAFLYRAELAGVKVTARRWQAVSDFAARIFPNPGIAFADVHSALAHAMAGNNEALGKIITGAKGSAGGLVAKIAEAFQAVAMQDWAKAEECLTGAMAGHERIGGSRAQRDLLEYTLAGALVRQGKGAEANLLLATRRPLKVPANAVKGL